MGVAGPGDNHSAGPIYRDFGSLRELLGALSKEVGEDKWFLRSFELLFSFLQNLFEANLIHNWSSELGNEFFPLL